MILDKLKNASLYYGLDKKIAAALKFLENNNLSEYKSGRHEIDGDEIFVLVQNYQTKQLSEGKFEAHKKYIDIQFIIEGKEKIGYTHISNLSETTEYDESKDIVFLEGNGDFVTAEKNMFVIFFPEDAHMPGIETNSQGYVKKAVIKIKI